MAEQIKNKRSRKGGRLPATTTQGLPRLYAMIPYTIASKRRSQPFIVFASVACTAVSSGAIHMKAGWEVLNLTLVPAVAIALAVVGWHFVAQRRVRAVAAQ